MRIILNAPARLPILSQTAEHALRAVLYLARNRDRDWVSATEIAQGLGAPPNYLAKTLRVLARRGILQSVRGAQGGFQLRVDADVLTAAEVVAAVDEVRTTAACLLGDRACSPTTPCEVHERWSALTARVLQPLSETTITDLLGGDPHGPTRTPVNSTPSR